MDAPREMRAFYQGLIQLTAAFVHLTRDEYPGTVRLLDAAIEKLEGYPRSYMGIELRTLVSGARSVLDRLSDLGEKRLKELDRASLPRIEGGARTPGGGREILERPQQ